MTPTPLLDEIARLDAQPLLDEIERLAAQAERERSVLALAARESRVRRRVADLLAVDPTITANSVYALLKAEKPGTRQAVLRIVREAREGGTSQLNHVAEGAS